MVAVGVGRCVTVNSAVKFNMSDAARKIRVAARGWATRASTKLSVITRTNTVTCIKLNFEIEQYDKRLNALDDAQSAVEREIDVEYLEADIDDAAVFRDKVLEARVQAATRLATMANQMPTEAPSEASGTGNTSTTEARLPKLELPVFCGDVTLWTSFWEQYQAVVHNSELPSITKFTYLLALLKEEAKACVQGLSLTASNYETACAILQKRFGRPERILFSHIQELLKITVPRQPTVAVLWKMYYDLQAHMRSLEALNITGQQYGVVLTPLVLSRLPPDLRLEWAREGELHESDLGYLLDFLQRELERRERSQTFAMECVTSKADVTVDTRPVSTVSALHTSTNKHADVCGRSGVTR